MKKKIRVLMFGWEFPPYISGGLGTACFGLTRHLSDQHTDILFVLPHVREEPSDTGIRLIGANQVEVSHKELRRLASRKTFKYFEVDSPLRPYLTAVTYEARLEELSHAGRRVETLLQKSKASPSVLQTSGPYGHDLFGEVARYAYIGAYLGATRDFDVIHAHDWMTFPAAVEAKRLSGCPLVVHIHATEYDRSGDHGNPMVIELERHGMEKADRVIAVSHRTKATIVDRYGIPADKIRVVHNAVMKNVVADNPLFPKGFDEKIVLFLGRVTLQKGPDYFVEAAHLVLKRMSNVRFVMAGTGDMLPRMIERVAQLRIQDHVHFTGFLRGAELESMFAMSDLYVMPSVSEPFGITPFEAMLYGVPTIISKQSGVSEVLNHVLTVDFWDIEKLASSIINVLSNPVLAQALVDMSRHDLERISWSEAARKVITIYRELLD